ncbi:MAG TPA: thermonuclease family protein [Vicinamibacterales bacterium]|nr:thermonuclease family protein [Vicinamibacterales bacterium]
MHVLHTPLVLLAAILQTLPVSAPVTRSDPLLVRAVVDGDTIDVATIGRVRLLGIDAPEIGRGYDTDAPFAREARARLTSLILRRWVRLEQDGAPFDVYDRRLAYVVTEDGVFVNALLVREGLARVSARAPLSRLAELQRAEAEAQAFRRGMWGGAPPIPTPSYTGRSKARRSPSSRTRLRSSRRRHARQKKP